MQDYLYSFEFKTLACSEKPS